MIIKAPSICISEVRYILDVMIGKFLGISFEIYQCDHANLEISCEDSLGVLSVPVIFFKTADKQWLTKKSIPKLPLSVWNLEDSNIDPVLTDKRVPVLFGEAGFDIDIQGNGHLKLDVFGAAFFMLSRYEEAVISDRDNYDRFPADASLAYQARFLDRPIINEYLEILWVCMKKIWPHLERKKRRFQMNISCDVDHPYQCGIKSLRKQLKNIGGDIIRRKSFSLAMKSTVNYFVSKFGSYFFDMNYTNIEWIMEVNEKVGNAVTFYFIAGHSDSVLDGCYSLDEPVIRKLMRLIHERGHKIGLHPSFNTYRDMDRICREAENLRRVLMEEGIQQDLLASRQHYLRWEALSTAQHLEVAGLRYDSTLAYASQPGFRCGICYEFPLYDLKERKQLDVIEQPLIVMEGTFLEPVYNAITNKDEMFVAVQGLVNTVKLFDGDFTLLWHNSYFGKKWYANCYEDILKL